MRGGPDDALDGGEYSAMQYIRIRNWDKFQYRTDKPLPWIKCYVSLLTTYEFQSLTEGQQGTLFGVLLLANETGNKIPNKPAWIVRRLNPCWQQNGDTFDAARMRMGRTLTTLSRLHWVEPWVPENERVENGVRTGSERGQNGGAFSPKDENRSTEPFEVLASASECDLDVDREQEKREANASLLVRKRARDEIWDTLTELCGEVLTENERGKRNNAVKQLRKVGATPDSIRRVADGYCAEWETLLTDMAIVNHYSRFANGASSDPKDEYLRERAQRESEGRVTA